MKFAGDGTGRHYNLSEKEEKARRVKSRRLRRRDEEHHYSDNREL